VKELDQLTPTQYLVMEVLAARTRMEHDEWPFQSRVSHTLTTLHDVGLVNFRTGTVEGTYLVELTEVGKKFALSDEYMPPLMDVVDPEEYWHVIYRPTAITFCGLHRSQIKEDIEGLRPCPDCAKELFLRFGWTVEENYGHQLTISELKAELQHLTGIENTMNDYIWTRKDT